MKDAFPMDPLPSNFGDKLTAAQVAEQQRQKAEHEKRSAVVKDFAAAMIGGGGGLGGVSGAAGNQAQSIGYYAYQQHDHMKDFALQKATEAAVDSALAQGIDPSQVAVEVIKAYKAAKEELDKA